MSVFTNGIYTKDEAEIIGFGVTLNADGSFATLTGPGIRRVLAAPTASANRGSLALRADAGNAGLYINTDNATTWAAFMVFGQVIPSGGQILLADNVNPSLQIGSTGALAMLAFDTTDTAERVNINCPLGLRVVAGGLTVTAGGASITGATTFVSGGVTVTAGGLTVTAGGLTVTLGGASITGATTFVSGGVTVTAGGLTVTAGGLTVSAGAVSLPQNTVNAALVNSAGADGVAFGSIIVAKTFTAGASNTDFALPARTGGWRIIDAYIRSNGATGGTLTVQTGGGAGVSDAMVPGNNNAITRAASIQNANATFASGATVRLNAAGGAPAGEAFLTLQPL